MNVGIFWVCAIEGMCAQTRPQFILSFERVWGNESKCMLTWREKSSLLVKISPEEYRTYSAALSRTASPTHYQQAIPTHTGWNKTIPKKNLCQHLLDIALSIEKSDKRKPGLPHLSLWKTVLLQWRDTCWMRWYGYAASRFPTQNQEVP